MVRPAYLLKLLPLLLHTTHECLLAHWTRNIVSKIKGLQLKVSGL